MISMVVSRQEWKQVTWRNGRGTSHEILARPDLMLNCTPISEDAPFSPYPGYDRVLAVIEGSLTLTVDGVVSAMTPRSVLRFPGEAMTAAHVVKGGAMVFNLVAGRNLWRATGAIVSGRQHFAARGGLTVLHVAHGTIVVGGKTMLNPSDTLITSEDIEVSELPGWAVCCHLDALAR